MLTQSLNFLTAKAIKKSPENYLKLQVLTEKGNLLLVKEREMHDFTNRDFLCNLSTMQDVTFCKETPRGIPLKRFFANMQQVYWKTPMQKCNFKKFKELLYGIASDVFIWKRLIFFPLSDVRLMNCLT